MLKMLARLLKKNYYPVFVLSDKTGSRCNDFPNMRKKPYNVRIPLLSLEGNASSEKVTKESLNMLAICK